MAVVEGVVLAGGPAVEAGFLSSAKQCPSPNCDARPEGATVDLLVIHSISLPAGQYGGGAIEALFSNRLDAKDYTEFTELVDLRVSAHLLIRRDGELLQFVNLDQRAWHAGESCFSGRSRCNDFSIGIELEGTDSDQFSAEQYRVLLAVTDALLKHYPALTIDHIVGHEDIAPGRKTDPGPGFDWQYYRRQLRRAALSLKGGQ